MNTYSLSPKSPLSPVTPSYLNNAFDFPDDNDESKLNPRDVLSKMGFVNIIKVTDTLQGTIWRGTDFYKTKTEQVIIKTTDRYLHDHAVSNKNGEMLPVEENIHIEQSILKFLTENSECPDSIVKFHKFFETNTHYYLVMEDGGHSLFDFVKKVHALIKAGRISITHWQHVVKAIFKQMVECISYIHERNVCHFDISLENWVINDVEVVVSVSDNKKEELKFVVGDIRVKLCDFGLAEMFTKKYCKTSKYVGKECYASPELVANHKYFDAKKNDIWCVGVCLFMMATGFTPFTAAKRSDPAFQYIVEYGKLLEVLMKWNALDFVNADLFDLVESMFQYEPHRINLREIKKHPWLQN